MIELFESIKNDIIYIIHPTPNLDFSISFGLFERDPSVRITTTELKMSTALMIATFDNLIMLSL
ncbi:hypothetical protein BC936DRAFT_147971 [Jimgerdemannia flammicorona]|uniref:Uncharacterized protein n=1 Tax=Jimgerdemannia flammicorona TaxID=994334 RepID=A0A433D443_9FUNG|nr:hypothetical protein BC936DRAFT_147971 [Jimgerdemannia flammicorona]